MQNKVDAIFQSVEDLKHELEALKKSHNDLKNQYDKNKSITDKRLDELEKAIKNAANKDDLSRLQAQVKELREEQDHIS